MFKMNLFSKSISTATAISTLLWQLLAQKADVIEEEKVPQLFLHSSPKHN
jgi:hypothetical protein